jgi:hypothetical protein
MEGLFDLPAETGAVDAVARARWDAAAARWLLVVGGAAVLAVAALAVTMVLAGR